MGLFEEAWKNRKLNSGNPKHYQKIVDSISKLKTEDELMTVLCTSPLYTAKVEAVNRISKERLIRFALEKFPDSFYDGLSDPFAGEKQLINHMLDKVIRLPLWEHKRLKEQGFSVDGEALSVLKNLKDNSLNKEVRNIASDRYQRCTEYLDYCRKMDSPEERFRMAGTTVERIEALRQVKSEKLIVSALNDKDHAVREEAVRLIKDHGAFVQWILSGSAVLPVGAQVFWDKIDKLNAGELETLANGLLKKQSGNVNFGMILKRVCKKMGHVPGNDCFCARCGVELPHDFDGNGVCRKCGARYVEEEETLTEAGVQYAKRTNRKIIYPDGRIRHLDPSTKMLVDDKTMKWLFQED